MDQIAAKRTENGLDTKDLLPFMSRSALTEAAEACFRQGGLEKAETFFPFLDEKTLEHLAKMEFEKWSAEYETHRPVSA